MKAKRMILAALSFSFILCSCEGNDAKKTIVWYVDSSNEWWIDREHENFTSVELPRIDALNQYLREAGKSYQVDIKTYSLDGYKTLQDEQGILNEIRKHDPDADIITYQDYWVKEYEVLDDLMETEVGKKLQNEVPKKTLEADKTLGKTYKVASLHYPIWQDAFVFLKDYYNKHEIQIKQHMSSSYEMMEYLNNSYIPQDDYILAYDLGFMIDDLMNEKYEKLYYTPFYIRRADKKIVNPYEEPDFLNMWDLLSEMSVKDFTGKSLEEKEKQSILDKGNVIFSYNSSYKNRKDFPLDEEDTSSIQLPRDQMLPADQFGYSILKSSKHKEEAFDLLAEVQCDPELSNILIYGEKPDVTDGIAKPTEGHRSSEYWGKLGNYLNSYPITNQQKNKKELFFKVADKADMSKFVSSNLVLDDLVSSLDEINKIVETADIPGHVDNSSDYYRIKDKKEVRAAIDSLNQKLKQAGIDNVMMDLQNQLDKG